MTDFEIQKRFYELYNQWKEETKFLSSLGDDLESYKEILQMGLDNKIIMIPLLLSNLGDSWLPITMLADVTNEVPWEEDDAGQYDVLSGVWYRWGRFHGYI
jgi:hypothetical protein